jgi:hypothetical protein
MGLIYPGEDVIADIVDVPILQRLTGISSVENPGMLVWILLFYVSYILSIFYPLIGIFFGVRILPFNENDGKELIFSTKKPPMTYFLENLLIVIILIPITVLPSFIILEGFLITSGGTVSALLIAFILPTFFVYVVTLVTSLGCSIKSSPKTGYLFGGVFFFVSFTLNLLQQELEFVKDINLMSQINAFQHVLSETWNEEFILKCLILMVILTGLTIYFLYNTDYIEERTSYEESIDDGESYGKKPKLTFLRSPVESILTRIGWNYPAFRDQLHSSAGLFLIYLSLTSLLLMLVTLTYPGDEVMNQTVSQYIDTLDDSPFIAAFMFNHPFKATLEGFLLLKIMTFHWIYYGPFLFIATYDIVRRDKNAGYDEITWAMPRTRTQVLIQRSIADIVYLWLIVIINFITLWIGVLLLGTYMDITYPDLGATIMAFIFLGLGYSIFLILFIGLALIPHPKYLLFTLVIAFIFALIIPIVWYLNQDMSWLLYLSPFPYFDVAGILLRDNIDYTVVIPKIVACGIVVSIFYGSIVKYWAPKKDIA